MLKFTHNKRNADILECHFPHQSDKKFESFYDSTAPWSCGAYALLEEAEIGTALRRESWPHLSNL